MLLSTSQTGLGIIVLNSIQANASNACSPLRAMTLTDLDLKANINGNTFSEVEPATYLQVTFSNNAKWTVHVEDIFRKFCKETS